MTTPNDQPLSRRQRIRQRLSTIEAAAAAGLICSIGWALSIHGLLQAPGPSASAVEIREYYSNESVGTSAVFWLQILVFSTIAFLWFVAVVRGRVGAREPRLFGTVFFGSSILLASVLFVGASLLAAPSVLVDLSNQQPDAGAASLLRSAAAILFSVFAPRISTLVMLSTASLARATQALPQWLMWLTYILAVIELVNVTVSSPTIYLMPAWIALVSIVLLVRRPTNAFELDRPSIWP